LFLRKKEEKGIKSKTDTDNTLRKFKLKASKQNNHGT